jgi:hypothetical protein
MPTLVVMNLQKIALLIGLSVASVLGSGAFSTADAILTTYNITNGVFSNGGTLNGSFKFDGSVYQDINLNVTPGSTTGLLTDFTYTSVNSVLSNVSPSGFKLNHKILVLEKEFNRAITLKFESPLPLSAGSSTTLTPSIPAFFDPSNEVAFSDGASNLRGITSGGIVTAVPWETDVLPLVGATIAFGAGAVAKRKIAQAKSKNLNFEPVKSECVSNVG